LAIRYRGLNKPFAMGKKFNITGFRTAYIDEEVDEKTVDQQISIEESLVALIFDRYAPAENYPESTDQKSTLDLVDEMESSSDISKNKIKMAMEAFGFKLHYTGSEFVWLLKERTNQ
jgi:hypothetical protein